MNLDDTIVAISSPVGAAPRGIVRLSGDDAVPISDRLFAPSDGGPLQSVRENRHIEGKITLVGASLPAAVCLFRAPRSYTRQDVVELHLLGAPGVLALAVEACLAAGARRAEPGEFTARAYLAGAFDLPQVHAIAGMIAARSDLQLRAAERVLHGALGDVARDAGDRLADLISLVEAALDFADEPIAFISPAELREQLDAVLEAVSSTEASGLRAERWEQLPRVVLVGPTNVGKSSLMNRLTGLDRAICAPIAGTTRDVLSAPMALGEWECLLLDGAGIGEPSGAMDAKSQSVMRRATRDADLILAVRDAAAVVDLEEVEGEIPRILVANKSDLLSRDEAAAVGRVNEGSGSTVCLTSAKTGAGCDVLKEEIRRALEDRPFDARDPAIALMVEHREALLRAVRSLERATELADRSGEHLANAELVAAELRVAAQALGTLIGQDETEDVLGRIFSRFCIGK